MVRQLKNCECSSLLEILVNIGNDQCKKQYMSDWAYTYGYDSDVYQAINKINDNEGKEYPKLIEVIKNRCPENYGKIVDLLTRTECGC